MKYETLAPYFTLAVAGLKDGSLDVCLPFPSTLSFSLSHFSLLPLTPPLSLSLLYLLPFLPLELSNGSQIHILYALSTLGERERERERERDRLPWEDCVVAIL